MVKSKVNYEMMSMDINDRVSTLLNSLVRNRAFNRIGDMCSEKIRIQIWNQSRVVPLNDLSIMAFEKLRDDVNGH